MHAYFLQHIHINKKLFENQDNQRIDYFVHKFLFTQVALPSQKVVHQYNKADSELATRAYRYLIDLANGPPYGAALVILSCSLWHLDFDFHGVRGQHQVV